MKEVHPLIPPLGTTCGFKGCGQPAAIGVPHPSGKKAAWLCEVCYYKATKKVKNDGN